MLNSELESLNSLIPLPEGLEAQVMEINWFNPFGNANWLYWVASARRELPSGFSWYAWKPRFSMHSSIVAMYCFMLTWWNFKKHVLYCGRM